MSDGALEFLKRAGTDGRIVSSNDLTTLQIAQAQACGRFYVEPGGGFGWALLPWDLTTNKDRQRESGKPLQSSSVAIGAILLLLAFLPSGVSAGYPSPEHHPAGYPYRATATSAPAWKFYHSPQYPGYFVRGTSEHDIDYHRLFTGKIVGHDAHGAPIWNYTPYVVPQLGSTVYGGSKTQYGLALELGYKAGVYVKPGVLKQLGDPAPLNAKDFLPEPAAQRQIDVEGAKKAFALVAEQQGQTDRAAIEAQLKERLAQIEASRTVAILQADERDQRLRQERLAILQRATSVSSSGDAGSDIPIADQAVRSVVSRNCFSCHGGDQGVKGGIDFRVPLTPAQESECKDQILSGLMPKGGAMSLEDQNALVGYFKGRVKAALGK